MKPLFVVYHVVLLCSFKNVNSVYCVLSKMRAVSFPRGDCCSCLSITCFIY